MKRYITILVFLLLLVSSMKTKEVKADIGPKASLTVTVTGISEPYFLDILQYEKYYNSPILEGEVLEERLLGYYLETYPNILNGYLDDEDFNSYLLYSPMGIVKRTSFSNTEQIFVMDYMIPDTYKIVLVTENDIMIVSETLTKTAFNTVLTFDLTGVDTSINQTGVGIVTGNISFARLTLDTLLRTILRVIYTLIIEIGILYIYLYRKKDSYIKVIKVNLVTQIILSLIVIYTYLSSGWFNAVIFLFLLEIIVFLVEATIYYHILKEHSKASAIAYAFVANLGSFLIGLLLLQYI